MDRTTKESYEMTHEELLAKINKELEITHWEAWHEGARALRAVVKLHRPYVHRKESPLKDTCANCFKVYPCPTIQAIEQELI